MFGDCGLEPGLDMEERARPQRGWDGLIEYSQRKRKRETEARRELRPSPAAEPVMMDVAIP